jgi:DNA helicase-2/ATP-dependent DNA helicase PcrA
VLEVNSIELNNDFLNARRATIRKDFENLNDMQFDAVMTLSGPLLVLAGAGSGKTTAIVSRIANLVKYGPPAENPDLSADELDMLKWYANDEIDHLPTKILDVLTQNKVNPENILAITFKNKAARELKSRLKSKIGEAGGQVLASTFHSACVRFLRRDIEKSGFSRDFAIFDSADQQVVIKECIKELNLDEKMYKPKGVLATISRAKNLFLSPVEYQNSTDSDIYDLNVSKAYNLYQERLKKYDALDFDDIIIKTVLLFDKYPEVLEYYQDKFKYIMVDEYQDTNCAQYRLVSLLAKKHKNLCVVGDDDQSIYKFRGADVRNILDFEKEFKTAKVIRLEENYRSTKNILSAANEVIKNNTERKGKNLWTECETGEKIEVCEAGNAYLEAEYISKTIKALKKSGKNYSDIAILYRSNSLSRIVENSLFKSNIPHRVFGGIRFYDRKEIKDLIAYLRLIQNPNDNVSLKRIINVPKRGIGPTSFQNIEELALKNGTSMLDVCGEIKKYTGFRSSDKIEGFCKMIRGFNAKSHAEDLKLHEFVESIISETNMVVELEKDFSVENRARIESINEFVLAISESEAEKPGVTLAEFLGDIALMTDMDNFDESSDACALMTIHSAKGLEFPIVFMIGLEEGIFPGFRSFESADELEEERRLCYVGITRAKEKLYLTRAKSRKTFIRTLEGSSRPRDSANDASRFISEIPAELLEFTEFEDQRKADAQKDGASGSHKKFDLDKSSFAKSKEPEKTENETSHNFNDDFEIGNLVAHETFGTGIITSIKPQKNDVKLEILFDGITKNLLASFANLKKIDTAS